MKYLCLICTEPKLEQMPEEEVEKLTQEYLEFTRDIKRSGHFLGANRLKSPETATTLRVRNGKVLISDGPFAETKEQIGGFYVIEAEDLNEAINIAARIPGAKIGCVELRPIAEDAQTRALELDVTPVYSNNSNKEKNR
jgi:hypothetical protein